MQLDIGVSGKIDGLPFAFISVSQKAWDAYTKAKMPRFYWDIGQAKKYFAKEETPWTPAVSVVYALQVGLNILAKEGLQNIFARHARVGKATRDGARALGLKPVADEEFASNTVTVDLASLGNHLQGLE
jgi:aspartate aminotransferase-like enzyme